MGEVLKTLAANEGEERCCNPTGTFRIPFASGGA